MSGSDQSDKALSKLLELKNAEFEYIRVRVAYALTQFDTPEAKAAIAELRGDRDYRVVGAAMENLL
ncbi:MAG: hypothetical protein WCP16_19675 [Pseudanabaena sp. ELA645]